MSYIKIAKYCSQACYRKSDSSKIGLFKKGHTFSDGRKNAAWKNGKTLRKDGYIKTHDNKLEHRKILESYLGRKLSRKESVHHLDGNKTNNKISNLIIFPNISSHKHFHNILTKLKVSLDSFSDQ